jgi:predicted small lipoprotein YifL
MRKSVMAYKARRTLVLSSILLLASLLPACGKKGPLYLPQDKPMAPAPAAPATQPTVEPTP